MELNWNWSLDWKEQKTLFYPFQQISLLSAVRSLLLFIIALKDLNNSYYNEMKGAEEKVHYDKKHF